MGAGKPLLQASWPVALKHFFSQLSAAKLFSKSEAREQIRDEPNYFALLDNVRMAAHARTI